MNKDFKEEYLSKAELLEFLIKREEQLIKILEEAQKKHKEYKDKKKEIEKLKKIERIEYADNLLYYIYDLTQIGIYEKL